jgi:hypothetical protein
MLAALAINDADIRPSGLTIKDVARIFNFWYSLLRILRAPPVSPAGFYWGALAEMSSASE